MPANIVIDTSVMLAVLLDEPEKRAVVEATMGSVVCAPASLRWEVGNAATAGVKRRRLTPERARQLITDFEQVTIRELAIDILRAVDLGLELGIYAVGFFFPVVPKGQARIRVQISAVHEREHLEKAVAAFAQAGRELGIVK